MLEKGTIAPEFALTSDDGKEVSLSDFRGKKVILYFYPVTSIPASKGKTSW
jgi:peroxiredoxin Q/BCP